MSVRYCISSALIWVAVVLPLVYYVALDVVIGLEKLWVPFGLSIAATFTCLLYVVATALYFTLDRYTAERMAKRKQLAYDAFVARKAAAERAQERLLRDKAVVKADEACRADKEVEMGDQGLALPYNPAERVDGEHDSRDEDMLSSIVGTTMRIDDRVVSTTPSPMSMSTNGSQQRHTNHGDGNSNTNNNTSELVRNPLTTAAASGAAGTEDGGDGDPEQPCNGAAVRKDGDNAHISDYVFATSSNSSITSLPTPSMTSLSSRQMAHRSGLEAKNTVKHNIGNNSNPRKAWQSFTSLLSDEIQNTQEEHRGSIFKGPEVSSDKIQQMTDGDNGGDHDHHHHDHKHSSANENLGQREPGAAQQDRERYARVQRTSYQQQRSSVVRQVLREQNDALELANIMLSIEEEESVRLVTRFGLEIVPRARIMLTMVHCVLVWVSSFIVAYYTNVLFAIIPVFSCPVMWYSIAPTGMLLQCIKAARMRRAQQKRLQLLKETGQAPDAVTVPCDCVCVKVVRVVTHWLAITVVSLISVLLYVAAIVLPLVRKDQLLLEPHKDYMTKLTPGYLSSLERVPTSIIAVCYLSPLPMITFMYVASMGRATMTRASNRLRKGTDQPHHSDSTKRSGHQWAGTAFGSGRRDVRYGADSTPHTPTGGNTVRSSVVGNGTAFLLDHSGRRGQSIDAVTVTGPGASFGGFTSSGTTSTLSSIVRSSASVGQSNYFAGPMSSNISMMLPSESLVTASSCPGRDSVVRFSRPQSVCTTSGVPGHAHVAPQLKTVTLLYIAFRDVFRDDNDASPDSGGGGNGMDAGKGVASSAYGGGAYTRPRHSGTGSSLAANNNGTSNAARTRQQIVTAKMEALLQAVEDARLTKPADAVVGGGKSKKEREKDMKAAQKKLNAMDEAHRTDSDAYILTAYEDAVVLVWGLLPFSSDPVKLAIQKAQRIFTHFRKNPKPYVALPNAGSHNGTGVQTKYELCAAVVYAPHTLVGTLGSSSNNTQAGSTLHYRSVHFFSPDQHAVGAALLERGFRLHRELYKQLSPATKAIGGNNKASLGTGLKPGDSSFSVSFSSREFLHNDGAKYYTGILIDSRAVHAAASNILARPCGVMGEEMLTHESGAALLSRGTRGAAVVADEGSGPGGNAANGGGSSGKHQKFTVMYDFVTFLSEKEEEWHLVVQRNERLSYHFRFLVEATQNLQQNNVKNAKEILQKGILEEKRKHPDTYDESENVNIAKMFLADMAYIELHRKMKADEEKALVEILSAE